MLGFENINVDKLGSLFISKFKKSNLLKFMLHVQTIREESAADRLQLVVRQERRQEKTAGLQLLGWEKV